MDDDFQAFLRYIPDLNEQRASALVDFFAYYVTVNREDALVVSSTINSCFDDANIERYGNVPDHLLKQSRKTKTRRANYVKRKGGYRLARHREDEIRASLVNGGVVAHASSLLRSRLPMVADAQEQAFLNEALRCYEANAPRATIVMVWILTLHHLYQHILKHKLADFNKALAANKDKSVKVTKVSKIDDFSDVPEGVFIRLARTARIISNDVRKILDQKLGTRNTSAHPSGVTISEVKVADFVTDLVANVIQKYPR